MASDSDTTSTPTSGPPRGPKIEPHLVGIRLVQEVNFGPSAEQRLSGMRDLLLPALLSTSPPEGREIHSEDETQFILVLPEMWPVGFFNFNEYREFANKYFNRFEALLHDISSSLKCWVFGGSAPYRMGDSYYNRSVALSPTGDAHYFDKLHLFAYKSQEADILTRGAQLVAFNSPLGKTGVLTCFDLRFPEAFRTLREQGCAAYVIVAAWPKPRLQHWKTLLVARAIENQAWVIGVNGHGLDFGTELGGGSMIVAPDGAIVTELADESHSQSVYISPNFPMRIRETFPFNDSRIPDLIGTTPTFPVSTSA